MTRTSAATAREPILDDGILAVSIDPAVRPWVERWLPWYPRPGGPAAVAATIDVRAGAPGVDPPAGSPVMEMHGVGAWAVPGGGVTVAGAGGRIGGCIGAEMRHAELHVRTDGDPPAIVQVVSALTMISGLLLAGAGRALVHAAAVVPPEGGGAWLLAGGSFSGKTTTCVTLMQAGWGWLSDDDVVLGPAPGEGVRAVGWPRRFDLDHGHGTAAPLGVRSRVDPGRLGPGTWRSAAPLAGLVFPRVEAGLPTEMVKVHAADALARMVHHAPWMLAGRESAGEVLKVLERSVRLPAFELRLGLDGYCNEDRLQLVLRRAFVAELGAKHGLEP